MAAYSPSDQTQNAFLSALALGETGNSSYAATEGVGGTNLAGALTDAFGFPQWQGEGSSHAAGTFQFQPGTWDQIASEYNLNFNNPNDQNAGAWYLAQNTFKNVTGGDLETALQNGDYQQIQSALSGVWPSVAGNSAAPQGLAGSLSNQQGASISNAGAPTQNSSASSSSSSSGGSWTDVVENFFVRFGLVIVGVIIIGIALYVMLTQTSFGKQVMKSV